MLQDELATEEKLLLESRSAYANGAPPALADEQKDPQRYADRIAKLRQSVQLHERNVEALRRELGLAALAPSFAAIRGANSAPRSHSPSARMLLRISVAISRKSVRAVGHAP